MVTTSSFKSTVPSSGICIVLLGCALLMLTPVSRKRTRAPRQGDVDLRVGDQTCEHGGPAGPDHRCLSQLVTRPGMPMAVSRLRSRWREGACVSGLEFAIVGGNWLGNGSHRPSLPRQERARS